MKNDNADKILTQDIDDVVLRLGRKCVKFKDKTILVTGATGLIGSLLVRVFLKLNEIKNSNINLILVVRSKEKTEKLFGDIVTDKIKIYEQNDITEHINIIDDVDYIVHTASPASSKFFVEQPVETIDAIFNGSKSLLELAKTKKVSKIILMSSMEAYGICGDSKVKEEQQGYVELKNVRSSYPIGKRAAEFLSYAYYKEYNVPAVSIRLAMCFGAGQRLEDPRVYKVFCSAALDGNDIEVKSTGKSLINFVYSADAILAILLLLLDGVAGEIYNVAGDALGYSILNMAEYIAKKNNVSVRRNVVLNENTRFAPDDLMILDTSKILALGWKPKYNIEEALDKYIDFLRLKQNL